LALTVTITILDLVEYDCQMFFSDGYLSMSCRIVSKSCKASVENL
jgi:hypothetical protein